MRVFGYCCGQQYSHCPPAELSPSPFRCPSVAHHTHEAQQTSTNFYVYSPLVHGAPAVTWHFLFKNYFSALYL